MFIAISILFVETKDVFCRNKHVFVATKIILVAAAAKDIGMGKGWEAVGLGGDSGVARGRVGDGEE